LPLIINGFHLLSAAQRDMECDMKQDYEEESLRTAKEALQTHYEALVNMVKESAAGDHRHLIAKDKIETDWSLLSPTAGYQIAIRSNNLEMVQAVNQAIVGTFFIVFHCGVSPSAKKYFNLQSYGPAGKKSGRSRKEDADMRDAWVRQEITRLLTTNKTLMPEQLTEKMRANRTAPGNLLCHERLVRFIRDELKIRKAGKNSSLRLVG
jgi:hypothetical protein